MSMHFDKKGGPISAGVWCQLFEDRDYAVLKRDNEVGRGEAKGDLSTIWLGLDHGKDDEGRPLIFETMIFGGTHDEMQWRYATEEEAIENHAAILVVLGNGGTPE